MAQQKPKSELKIEKATLTAEAPETTIEQKIAKFVVTAEYNSQASKIRCRMNNWRVAKIGHQPHLYGNIEDHPAFAKGEPVRSSPIELLDLQKMICITEKEIIKLENPATN